MTKFRPCIDLHSGQVKQIVGGTLTPASTDLKTNFVSKLPAKYFAKLYKDNDLEGAHVIMLGPGNEDAAREALREWHGGLQVGGGITEKNADQWIKWGAERVCIYLLLSRYLHYLVTRWILIKLIWLVGHCHLISISRGEILAAAPKCNPQCPRRG